MGILPAMPLAAFYTIWPAAINTPLKGAERSNIILRGLEAHVPSDGTMKNGALMAVYHVSSPNDAYTVSVSCIFLKQGFTYA